MSETSDPFRFISKQKWITITAIGSILTFTLINKIKEYILFPLMNYVLPKKAFEKFEIVLEENEKKETTLYIGKVIQELLLWTFLITFLYFMTKKTSWPIIKEGSSGTAF